MNTSVRHYSTPIKRLAEGRQVAPKPYIESSVDLVSRKIQYSKPTDADLAYLREAGSDIYATVHIYERKFLVTLGDKLLIPTEFKNLSVGDEISLNEVSVIGSRDYTLSGAPRIDPSVFDIKGVVVEKTRTKRHVAEKTKRRRRHVRHIVSKNCVTAIRISELTLK